MNRVDPISNTEWIASGGNSGPADQAMDYGLPPRPPTASTAIWQHLLGTTTTTEAPKSLKDIPIIAPPMAPLDKNATSMRVLLHDTQANFERFTTQVEKLFETLQETKNELKTMHSLFRHDRETLTGDIVDLVNRSQREIQKAIGTPTQSDAFETLCKNINHRLDGLDQRFEAINSFNQTHSQALQTQMHTIQLILDKQGSILSAVTPLLPFLQGLPPLIEALRTALTEKLQELSTSLQNLPRNDIASIPTSKRKRTFVEHDTTLASPSFDNAVSPRPAQKRSRIMDPPAEASSKCTETGQETSPLLLAPSPSPLLLNPASSETFSGTMANAQPPEKRSPATQNSTTPRRRLNDFAVPPFPPPSSSRRRLGAIDLAGSSIEHGSSSSAALMSGPKFFGVRSHTQKHQEKPNTSIFGLTPTATRTPRTRVHTSIAAKSRSNSVVSVESHAVPASMGDTLNDPNRLDAPTERPKHPKHDEQDLLRIRAAQSGGTKAISAEPTSVIGRITRSNTRVFTTTMGLSISPQPSVKEDKESDGKKKVAAALAPPRPPQPSTKEQKKAGRNLITTDPPDAALKGKNFIRSFVPGKAKERRSPMKEGRRFIPLIDSDDDEENQ